MFKKIIFIVVPIIMVSILIFVFGIKTYNSRYISFQKDGHILAKNKKSTTKKYYFDTSSKYKFVDDNVYILNKDEKTVIIPKESFVHYADGSISTFSKAVVLDLDDLNKDIYKYYNVFSEAIFVKNGKIYSVNYLDKKLNFSNFLLKINNNKYMIIGQKMKLKIGDVEKSFENTYLEISYLDGNMLRIENQNVSFQSVDDLVSLELDNDVILDLSNQNIYKDKEKKLSFGEITVDSDDNIKISTEDNKSIFGDAASEGSESSSDSSRSNNKNQLPNVSSGVVDTTVNDIEQIIDENSRIKDPEFKVNDMTVSANRLRASIQVIDEEGVLDGAINIKVIEASSNKIVYEANDDSGSNNIDVDIESLIPETNYILVVNSDYKKNNVDYNKDFVQKTFITDAIGVSVDKLLITEDELQIDIKKSSYSEVVSVMVSLVNSENSILETQTVSLNNDSNVLQFKNLDHNSNYKVNVYNFVYKDSIVVNDFSLVKEYQTLKIKPTVGLATFSIDKRESKFDMMINNVSDPDNGIVNYKYEIYENITEITEESEPIAIIEKGTNTSASVNVDGKTIKRGYPYIFRVVMEFNDNEKSYEYVSQFSNVMKLDGVVFPTIRFIEEEITHERIRGAIEITDDGNTIDMNYPIIITYKDSVGNSISNSFNSLYNSFDYNDLRKNESYVFSVTARVNLYDGNPVIDSCYIGSVVVHTKDPDPFVASWQELSGDDVSGFSVKLKLNDSDSANDSNLEANTLTKLYLKIYPGNGSSNQAIKSVPFTDLLLDEPYKSTLKTDFYDNEFTITPSTFNLRSNELREKHYTIEVTDAIDYTTHQNGLPIYSNRKTVETKAIIPDLPDNPEDAVECIPIYNRDVAGTDRYREDLYDSTIVGYRYRAKYDNSRGYAKTIHYYVNSSNGQSTLPAYYVPESGEISYSELYLKDALKVGITDGELRRGMSFYLNYNVDLDTNGDTIIDNYYPPSSSNVVLKSEVLYPERQSPEINMYPSTMNSSTNKYNWKYTYSDIDHTLKDEKLYSRMSNSDVSSEALVNSTQSYTNASFNYDNDGMFSIYGSYQYNDGRNPSEMLFASHYIEPTSNVDFGQVYLTSEKNRVIFSFLDYQEKEELFNRISSVKLTFIAGDKRVVLDGLYPENGNITINFSKIEELQGKTVTVDMKIYYDAGIYGYENGNQNSYAIQNLKTSPEEISYYYSFENGGFNPKNTANGSYVTYLLDLNNKSLTVSDIVSNRNRVFNIDIDRNGISTNGIYMSPKLLNEVNGNFSNINSFYFDTIIPGISILDDSGSPTTVAKINSASFKFTSYGMTNKLRDDKFYIELFNSDELGNASDFIRNYEYNISDLNDDIVIDNLVPNTNYAFKVFGYIKDGNGVYNKEYLYDVDRFEVGVLYRFKTINNIGIEDVSIWYSAKSYNERNINLSYTIDDTIGVDHIKYLVYKKSDLDNPIESLNISNDFPARNILKKINISNNSDFSAGKNYVFKIIPVSKLSDGTLIELAAKEKSYKFKKLYKPYFNVSRFVNDNSLYYRVNISDYNKSIVNGNYKIQILDSEGNDVTPSEYLNNDYSINDTNKLFEFEDYDSSMSYTFNILYKLDIYNDSSRISNLKYTYNSGGSSSDIDLGNIYVTLDSESANTVNLSFFDSIDIDKVKVLRYSLYNESGFSIDNEVEFVTSVVSSGSTTYHLFQLPDLIPSKGIYYLSMQFLDDDGNVLDEETMECRLI